MPGTAETVARLRGLIAALPTPMAASGHVDAQALARLVDWLAGKGVDGVFVGGTTGEGALLTEEERLAVTAAAVEAAGGRLPVIGHVGAPSTAATLELARRCLEAGADALAAVTPYYYRFGDAELIEHYAALAAAVPNRPILLYNIPSAAGNTITPAVIRGLRDRPNIVGIKDSSGDAYLLLSLAAAARPGFRIIVGNDLLALQAAALRWDGMVSGPASAIPEPYVALWAAAVSGSWEEMAASYTRITRVVAALRNGDIPRIKAALALRGVAEAHVRPPLRTLSPDQIASLSEELGDVVAL